MNLTKNTGFIHDSEIAWEDLGGGLKRKIMSYDEQVMMVKVAFEVGGIGTLHHHPHRQMSYVASGVFELTIDGQTRKLQAGDGYFVLPDLIHGALCLQAGELIDIFIPFREDFI